ncbi:MAG: AAA family ATPase [Candidatus Thorarchaeota archaeon]
MRKFLLATCGIPASGKTTLARAIVEALAGTVRAQIVSTDDLRSQQYYEDFRPEREHAVRADALRRTEHLLQRGLSVIHDDTNYYASMRHELLSLANRYHAIFAVVHVATPLETALRWNEERRGPIPPQVLQRIAQRIDIPGERYRWDRPLAVVDLSQVDVQRAAEYIASELIRVDRSAGRTADTRTITGQRAANVDILTRRAVTEYLRAHPQLRGSPEISRIRREVLRAGLQHAMTDEEVLKLLREKLPR